MICKNSSVGQWTKSVENSHRIQVIERLPLILLGETNYIPVKNKIIFPFKRVPIRHINTFLIIKLKPGM